MNFQVILGYALIATPFVATFVFMWRANGFREAVTVFVITGIVVAMIAGGVILTGVGQ